MKSTDEQLREVLTNALTDMIAHAPFDRAVKEFPGEYLNKKPDHSPHTFYHLIEHIRLSMADIVAYITDPEYEQPDWPDDYWPSSSVEGSALDFEESITEIRQDFDTLTSMLDSETDLFAELPYQKGSGHSRFREIILVISHNSYHIGQFILMRKQMNIWL